MLVMLRLEMYIILLILELRSDFMRNNSSNKLVFYYGAMGSGKTRDILKLLYSKKEDGFYPVLMKPKRDVKGDDTVISRDNTSFKVNFLVGENDNVYFEIAKYILNYNVDYILVDEAQFLSKAQIDQLSDIVDELGIDVICYGLLTDFRGNMFEGSKRLMEISDDKIEMERQCTCGRKKLFNARMLGDLIVLDGAQVGIDGKIEEEYRPVCRQCYKKLIREKRSRDE